MFVDEISSFAPHIRNDYLVALTLHDLQEMLPFFLVIMIALPIVLWTAVHFIKRSDDSKPVQTARITVLECPSNSMAKVQWYVVEFDDGTRMKLRSFKGDSLILRPGDCGVVAYQGSTISSFKPSSK